MANRAAWRRFQIRLELPMPEIEESMKIGQDLGTAYLLRGLIFEGNRCITRIGDAVERLRQWIHGLGAKVSR